MHMKDGPEITVISVCVGEEHWTGYLELYYQKEVADLARLNHENTRKLLGYCIDSSLFTRMLVFEYVSNGTLYEHLHCKSIFILFMSKYMPFDAVRKQARPGGWVGPKCVLFVFLIKRSAFIFTVDKEGCHLSWSRRMNIIVGVAKSLRYLHTEIEPPFTISELNSSAVYLTEDFSPSVYFSDTIV
ncbi:putative protein kinase RLK-Pelle-LRR-VI-2 family [Helianthus annuus]|nr:putative protein kinase RLK-Pelle-LRR-VI-2 family [Helianthus annuus]KAJ0521806.1 putative protein kinase RLK-Pelle-LRR-VI-2 family [Helianthus annuus]KAJ0529959.1 putative protein kinase RLK-Pelle-LRR-VI-2 family [Helianthus annuus]KAJ0696826.1 putative protein kinase RLK-Pelle-LRR-VI-2 family [Helianthus annuus]KAJ0879566.1 putative protein kinase RLK-Pelle-LRR-VI-2 family [Helianthus annuus]